MKFQTIIIGGGLSGLMAGIELARKGQKVAIVSAGQSALHFSSGSLELLSHTADGKDVTNPIAAMETLPDSHPYKKIGVAQIAKLASKVNDILAEAGIGTTGKESANHYRLSPMGKFKPAWLTLSDYPTFDSLTAMPWKKVCMVNLKGYLDFYPQFLALGLEKTGVATETRVLSSPELDILRKSPSEMRSPNIARILTGDKLMSFANAVKELTADSDADAILLPAVLGLNDSTPVNKLREVLNRPVYFISTVPASVPGIRTQLSLRAYFQKLGGIYLLGDNVTGGNFTPDGKLKSLNTANLGEKALTADSFILAGGSFFSHGLVARPDSITEPIFGLDVHTEGSRGDWFNKDLYSDQPFMKFGIRTDGQFRTMKNGAIIPNLYGCGSILAGANAMKEGSGAGIAILTALNVAQNLSSNTSKN